MGLLFPIEVTSADVPSIPGLVYRPAFISEAEEAALASAIDAQPWDTSWERRRQYYGTTYGRTQQAQRPIPDWAQPLVDRLYQEGVSERPFDQMLVNDYLPGQGIALHRDYQPFDRTVVSLSLLSACVMDFRHALQKHHQSLLLERRSLLILSDEARYDWQHGISRRKNDRWQGLVIPRQRRLSITFRLRRKGVTA